MKDRKMFITMVMMIFATLICVAYLFYNTPMDENIKNISWYNYNIKTGVFNKLVINDNNIEFLFGNNDYNNCTAYSYNTRRKTINLNCDKELLIKSFDKEVLTIKIESKEVKFFKSSDESLDYEFEKYYGKSVIEYKEDKDQVTDVIKIESNMLNSMFKEEKSIVVFKGDNCSNIDCTLLLGTLEKWIVYNERVYFVDSNAMMESDINNLTNLNKEISNNVEEYNQPYPLIMIIGDNDITIDSFKCKGFDCSMWKDFSKNIKKLNKISFK